jgi:hypothetical protein
VESLERIVRKIETLEKKMKRMFFIAGLLGWAGVSAQAGNLLTDGGFDGKSSAWNGVVRSDFGAVSIQPAPATRQPEKDPVLFTVEGKWPGYNCPRVKEPMVLGGNFETQWKPIPPIVLAEPRNFFLQLQLPWKGPDDLSAETRLAYDDQNLYLSIKVRDDVFTQNKTGGDAWNGDSLQFAISDDGRLNYWEFTLALCEGKPVLVCHHAGSGTDIQEIRRQARYQVRRLTDTVVLYEAAIPWRCLPPLSSVSDEFRFSFIVNEADNGPRKGWMEWTIHSGIGEVKDPSRYGFVRLKKDKVGPDAPLKGLMNLERNTLTDDDEMKVVLSLSSGKPMDGTLAFSLWRNQKAVTEETRKVKITDMGVSHLYGWKTTDTPGGVYTVRAVFSDRQGKPQGQWQKTFEKINRKEVEQVATEFRKDAGVLSELLRQCRAKNIPTPYQTAVLALAGHFAPWVKNDLTLKERPYNPLPDQGPLPDPQKIVGPIKALFWNRAKENAEYVREQVKLAIDQAKELLVHPETTVTVPSVDLKTLKSREGVFCDKNGPVIFLGALFGDYGTTPDHLKMTSDYGLAWWGIGVGGCPPESKGFNYPVEQWGKLTPYDQWPDGWLGYKNVREKYTRARELNVAVYSWYPWWNIPPGVTGEKHDPGCKAGFFVDIEDPVQTKILSRYLNFIAGGASPYRDVFVNFMLQNEVNYGFCSCSRGLRDFKKAMREQYGTIEKLNEHWGTVYKSFEELTVPASRIGNKGHWYDYNIVHQKKLPQRLAWLARETKKACLDVSVSGKTLNGLLDCWDYCEAGMDREQVGDVTDIWEFDGYVWYGPSGTQNTLAFNPWMELGSDDLHRSLKNVPMLETEYHCIPWDYWGKVNPDHIKACFWTPAIHGVDGFLVWIWERPGYNGCNGNPIDEHADRIHAFSTASLDLRRLAKYVTAIPAQPSEVAILASTASLINQDNQWNTYMEVYRSLYWLNTPPTDFISERQIASGKLNRYKLLVVHNSPYLPEKTFTAIREFVRQGGTVVLTLDAARWDPYGKPLPVQDLIGGQCRDLDTSFKPATIQLQAEDLFEQNKPILSPASRKKLFKPTSAKVLGLHGGTPVITVNQLGKGRVYYVAVDMSMESWTAFWDRVFIPAGVRQGNLPLKDNAGRPLVGVEHREATVDGKRIIYLMNMTCNPIEIPLPNLPGRTYKDLVSCKPIPGSGLILNPLVPFLLSAEKKDSGEVRTGREDKVNPLPLIKIKLNSRLHTEKNTEKK